MVFTYSHEETRHATARSGCAFLSQQATFAHIIPAHFTVGETKNFAVTFFLSYI